MRMGNATMRKCPLIEKSALTTITTAGAIEAVPIASAAIAANLPSRVDAIAMSAA
jgi:hypothetical protein